MAPVLMTYDEVIARVGRDRTPGRDTTLLAVDGHGGSGKSTFARRLAGRTTHADIVHTDDFAKPGLTEGLDVQRLLDQVITPLRRDRSASYQRFDWRTQRLAEWHRVTPGGLAIVEGVSALRHELGDPWDLAVWIETPRHVCLRRGLERDGEAAETLWEQWFDAEDRYVARDDPRARADLMVDGSPTVEHDPTRRFVVIA